MSRNQMPARTAAAIAFGAGALPSKPRAAHSEERAGSEPSKPRAAHSEERAGSEPKPRAAHSEERADFVDGDERARESFANWLRLQLGAELG